MSRTIRKFMQFPKLASKLDMRPDHGTRKMRAERHARKYKTCGKRAVFEQDYEAPQPLVHGLADSRDYVDWPPMGY
jgi:hypothetical protein